MNFNVDLLKGKVLKSLVIFSLPFLFSNIFQQLYNTVDTFIVGNTLNENSLAAIGACGAVYELMVGFALGIGNGLSVVVARAYGAGNKRMVKKSIAASFVIAIIITVFLMLLSIFGLYPLLKLLNTPGDIIDEAYSYIFTITIFVGVMMAYNLLSGILKAVGNSIMPLVFLIISSVINIGLDVLFIAKIGTGIVGAAIATVIAQCISAILCAIFLVWKYKEILPKKEDFVIDKLLYKDMWGQGLSMGLMSSIVSMGTVVLQYSINGLGNLVIAGHTAARKIFTFSTLPIMTLGMSLTTFISQNRGANQKERIRQAVKYGNIITTVWSIIIAIVLMFVSPMLIQFISGSQKSEVLINGTNYLRFNVLFYIPLGVLINVRCALQGIGAKILPLVSSFIELLGKIVFTFLLIPQLHYTGVIICEPVVWCLMAIQLTYAFYTNNYIKRDKIRNAN